MQQASAADVVSARMARADAICQPAEPPNPPIVESAQPVLPLGGAPVQARISPGSKPERIARRRAQRAPQPAAPDGEAIASMVGEYDNNTIYQGTGWGRTAVGEYERNTLYHGTGWGRSAMGEFEALGGPAAGGLLLLGLGQSEGHTGSPAPAGMGCMTFCVTLGVIGLVVVLLF